MIGYGVDEVSIRPAVYPHGSVSVSSLGYFPYVGSSFKTSHSSPSLYIYEHTIFKIISRIRGRGSKNSLIHSRISPGARTVGIK